VPKTNGDLFLVDEKHYEIVNGERLELPPMGAYQSVLASFLVHNLGSFAWTNDLGRVVSETLFQLDREGKLQRRPDAAFVSFKRWPKKRRVPDSSAWDVIPELAIEVNSPSNTANEILQKILDYFNAGVLCVWVIYPSAGQVYVYSSPTETVILTTKDHLEGGSILPGFRFPINQLFDSEADEPEALPAANGAAPPS
jgi:Uma2 family endonuclease